MGRVKSKSLIKGFIFLEKRQADNFVQVTKIVLYHPFLQLYFLTQFGTVVSTSKVMNRFTAQTVPLKNIMYTENLDDSW